MLRSESANFSIAISIGKGVVADVSALGLGALCFYGLGFSAEPGAIERSMWVIMLKVSVHWWPDYSHPTFSKEIMVWCEEILNCFEGVTINPNNGIKYKIL